MISKARVEISIDIIILKKYIHTCTKYVFTTNCALCKLYIFSFTQDNPLLLDFLFLTYLFIHNYIHTCIPVSVVHTC